MNLIESIVNNGHGYLNPSYLFIHETANPGAAAKNHRDLYSRGWEYAVHYVSDWTGDVYHCMYDDHLAWAVGNGNPYGVSLEICHATNAEDFKRAWDTAVEFAAFYLKKRGWGLSRMLSHDECRQKWGGTDHTDPIGYFRSFGKSWADFKNDVLARMTTKVEEKKKEFDLKRIVNNGGEVYRAYNKKTGAHIFALKPEYDSLKDPWTKEGKAFTAPVGSVAIYRLMNPNNGTYMYTADFTEAEKLEKAGWNYEGVHFFGNKEGTAVYRLYNPSNGDHMFTASLKERDDLVKAGWKYEAIAFYMK